MKNLLFYLALLAFTFSGFIVFTIIFFIKAALKFLKEKIWI